MHARRRHGTLKKSIVTGLVALSIQILFVPRSWTSGMISLVQVLVPFQDAADSIADGVSETTSQALHAVLPATSNAVPAAEMEEAKRQLDALQHLVGTLSARVNQLENDNRLLSGTRFWDPNGQKFGMNGTLLPGTVIVGDTAYWRSSRLLNAGTLQGVSQGSAVVSKHFSVNVGEMDGVKDGMPILLQESLVGLVDDVGTHTARVRLLCDVGTELRVHIAKLSDGNVKLIDGFFWLTGKGRGKMEVRDRRHRVQEAGIEPGDIILSPPDYAGLPTAMCIGEVESIEIDRKKPLIAVLGIVPRVNLDRLERVYVFQQDTPQ